VDLVGMSRIDYPANILPVRVPCLGWVSLYQIFKTLESGADGILLVGCKKEQCQNLMGDVFAERVVRFTKDIFGEIGLNSGKIKMVSLCAANPKEFLIAGESLINDVKDLKK